MTGTVGQAFEQIYRQRLTTLSLLFMALHFASTRSYILKQPFLRRRFQHWREDLQMSSSGPTVATDKSKLVVVIAGPTAAGKSDVAAHICAKNKGLIISADSVQAYRGVQIGANKPSPQERLETPHILIDMADHNDTYNAAEWNKDAVLAVQSMMLEDATDTDEDDADMISRRHLIMEEIDKARSVKGYDKNEPLLPVVCGGTMMYIQWLVHGRPDAMQPSEDAIKEAARAILKYQNENDFQGAVEYVASMGKTFAERITKLCGEDWYRLRRILEVALTVNDQQNPKDLIDALYSGERYGGLPSMGYDVRCFFLCPDDRMQHTNIVDERCEQMILKGLLKETSDLSMSGRMPEMAARAIGYRQTLDYLCDDGSVTNEEERFNQFLNDFSTATRRYAKKQMSWFRKDKEFMFVPVPIGASKEDRVDAATSLIQSYCDMSRQDYETNLYSIDGESARCKKMNEEQGNKMKFYQFQRYILKENSSEFESALSEALGCRQRMHAKKRRVEVEAVNSKTKIEAVIGVQSKSTVGNLES